MATAKQTKPSDIDLDDAPAKTCDVFLVDGNGLAYRAFHALPEELQTADGQPTNALLGMAMMLMKAPWNKGASCATAACGAPVKPNAIPPSSGSAGGCHGP